jgi:hypothetical protein
MFQIVRVELDTDGRVVARRALQPHYDLFDDAMALAEFDASRCEGDYDYDDEHRCWSAVHDGRQIRFIVQELTVATDVAA